MKKYFGIKPENQTEDLICDVRDKIKDVIDNHEYLYDDIDYAIGGKLSREKNRY